jgi:hypothetical protein
MCASRRDQDRRQGDLGVDADPEMPVVRHGQMALSQHSF